jgi:hypothetical protein
MMGSVFSDIRVVRINSAYFSEERVASIFRVEE